MCNEYCIVVMLLCLVHKSLINLFYRNDVVEDGVIQIYDDHEDSVYAVEWSAADFWTFASISYDGRLVINKVPRSIKYKQFM